MKLRSVILLVAGAALAGGLALRMSQPPPIVISPAAPVPVAVHASPPVVVSASPAVKLPPVKTPPAMPRSYPPRAKPSPFSGKAAQAPAPVYVEPVEPAIRKNKPILTAKALPAKAASEKAVPEDPSPQLLPPVPYEAPPAPVAPQIRPLPRPAPRQVTLRTGITIPVRLTESLSSDRSVPGDTFSALLAEPLVVDGLVIAERGARVTGRIVDARKAGWFGTSSVELELASIVSSDGQKVAISTDPWTRRGDALPPETIIRFRLATKVTISERQL
jgi:hypothetical protein